MYNHNVKEGSSGLFHQDPLAAGYALNKAYSQGVRIGVSGSVSWLRLRV